LRRLPSVVGPLFARAFDIPAPQRDDPNSGRPLNGGGHLMRHMMLALLILLAGTEPAAQSARPITPVSAQTEAQRAIADSSARLPELEALHAAMVQSGAELSRIYSALSRRIAEAAKTASDPALAQSQLKQLQEMNQSFNTQYLYLQQKMQDESRRFTLLSNVMKTKHDTAKNSISNVR
jgi:hypothetical protein